MQTRNLLTRLLLTQLLMFCGVSYAKQPANGATTKPAPKAPAVIRLTADSDADSITLSWQLAHTENLRQIQVYRKDYPLPLRVQKPDFSKPAKIDRGLLVAQLDAKQRQFRDDQPEPGYYYYYRLVLQDNQRMETEPSAAAIGALKDVTPPQAPQILGLKALDSRQFEIHWQASASTDVVAYRIYRATLQGSPQVIHIDNLQQGRQAEYSRSLENTGNPQFEYRYFVAAVDGAGNLSTMSKPRRLRMPDRIAPQAPALLTAQQQGPVVELSWLASRENDLAGYRVYRRINRSGTRFKPLHEKLLSKTEFTDTQLRPLTAYRYRVAAIDRFGNESHPTRGILFRTTAFSDELKAPQRLRLKTSRQGLPLLSWQANKPGKIKGSLSYLVLRSDGEEFSEISGLLSSPQFTDASIIPGKAYRYRVQAIDQYGNRSVDSSTVLWTGRKR